MECVDKEQSEKETWLIHSKGHNSLPTEVFDLMWSQL